MKYTFYLLAVISAIAFIYGAIKLSNHHNNAPANVLSEEKIKAIDTLSEKSEVPKERVKAFLRQPTKVPAEPSSNQNWYFWLSFLATALTAGSALVSSIQAATNNPNTTKTALIVVAFLTFFSTLAGAAAGHFNS